MPDFDTGGHRMYEALRGGKFVLVGGGDAGGWSDRVDTLAGGPAGKLPDSLAHFWHLASA